MQLNLKHELITILRGARNGFYYGGKVRIMHSLVIQILFGKGTLLKKLKTIIKNTISHGTKLAKFVFIFKSILLLLKIITKKSQNWHHFIGGCIGGYIISSSGNDKINQQLILYLLSRNITGGLTSFQKKGFFKNFKFFEFFAFLTWGVVMLLFNDNKECLQRSLKSSMEFLYEESEDWKSWKDFVPFYIP